jgi:uncharacterized protein YabN with tetrapyrrole methylase and pyrophosphatase domain
MSIRPTSIDMSQGSLDIVGLGIQAVQHTSSAVRYSIEKADKVLYVMADPVSEIWIKKLNPSAETLHDCYRDGEPRMNAYRAMVERILDFVRKGQKVTFASYGHPSVFCLPAHKLLKYCRKEGISVNMLPAISAEDCLFADLGFDPATNGCQSYEATDFIVRKRRFDTSSPLILWQIGVIGILTYISRYSQPPGLKILVQFLSKYYPLEHNVIVYEAAQYPICNPLIKEVQLKKICSIEIGPLSTLYIPPLKKPKIDKKMIRALGIDNFAQSLKDSPKIKDYRTLQKSKRHLNLKNMP